MPDAAVKWSGPVSIKSDESNNPQHHNSDKTDKKFQSLKGKKSLYTFA